MLDSTAFSPLQRLKLRATHGLLAQTTGEKMDSGTGEAAIELAVETTATMPWLAENAAPFLLGIASTLVCTWIVWRIEAWRQGRQDRKFLTDTTKALALDLAVIARLLGQQRASLRRDSVPIHLGYPLATWFGMEKELARLREPKFIQRYGSFFLRLRDLEWFLRYYLETNEPGRLRPGKPDEKKAFIDTAGNAQVAAIIFIRELDPDRIKLQEDGGIELLCDGDKPQRIIGVRVEADECGNATWVATSPK